MNTAVHNTASLADVLLADGASAGKSADDDRDKTNTVDFGATLTSFIDQTAAGKTPPGSGLATSSPSVRGKHSADAPTAFDSRTQDAPTSFDWSARNASTAALDSASADPPTTSDPSAADAPKTSGPSATVTPTAFDISTAAHVNGHFSKVAGTPKVGSKAPATVQTQEVGTQTSNARSDSLAALLDDRTVGDSPPRCRGGRIEPSPNQHQCFNWRCRYGQDFRRRRQRDPHFGWGHDRRSCGSIRGVGDGRAIRRRCHGGFACSGIGHRAR